MSVSVWNSGLGSPLTPNTPWNSGLGAQPPINIRQTITVNGSPTAREIASLREQMRKAGEALHTELAHKLLAARAAARG
ncbi:MAG TPA: hypothetical protein VNF71_14425 [Acidimicrobiales bacterium]|nr:hypothetical protein [Acidimicrobiales bacterium]